MIDGFLDMILPVEQSSSHNDKAHQKAKEQPKTQTKPEHERSWSRSEYSFPGGRRGSQNEGQNRPRSHKDKAQKPLFTVKPGGIAGYLCKSVVIGTQQHTSLKAFVASLCQTASYVDIVAKTDTYVGFLPSPALERIKS